MTQPTIRDALRANMHDGDEGGRLTMNVKDLLDESTEIVREFVLDDEIAGHIEGGRFARALQVVVNRLGGFPPSEEEAEAFIHKLIAPATPEIAAARRAERDR